MNIQQKEETKLQCEHCDYFIEKPTKRTDKSLKRLLQEKKQEMKRHIRTRHFGIYKYGCNICDYRIDRLKFLREKHFIKEHPGQKTKVLDMFCQKCVEKAEGHDHEFRTTKENKEELKCLECSNFTYKDFNAKLVHYKNVHPKLKIFSCDIEACPYKTNYLSNLKGHKISLHEKKLQTCELCPFQSHWKQTMLSHMRNVHSEFQMKGKYYSIGETFLCESCGWSTMSKELYENHLKRPSFPNCKEQIIKKRRTNGKYSCEKPDCIYTTNVKSMVRTHQDEVHDGVKRYACSICDYKSYHRGNVILHQKRYHKNETCGILRLGEEVKGKRGRKPKS